MRNTRMESKVPGEHTINPQMWVLNYADYLFHFAITRINDEDAAKDLVQDTFLSALEKIDLFEGRSSEKTWLTAILKNKLADIYRKRSSGLLKNEDSLHFVYRDDDFFETTNGHWKEEHQPKAFDTGSYDPSANKELSIIIQGCISKLPPLWLSVFTMKHIDEESTELICNALKITPSNFWVIIHRSKVNLRACLQKNWM